LVPPVIPRNGSDNWEGKEGKARKDGDGSGLREDKWIWRGIGAFSERKKPFGGLRVKSLFLTKIVGGEGLFGSPWSGPEAKSNIKI